MNLIIDIGNSLAKAVVVEDGREVDVVRSENLDAALVATLLERHPGIGAAILSSLRPVPGEVEDFIRARVGRYLRFDNTTPVPLVNRYATPETLGTDRLAAAVGASDIFPGENILVVDFGTAITIDIVTAAGEFLGGNISPGAGARFRALHDYTCSLPLRNLPEAECNLTSRNSHDAIENGVVTGILHEIEGYIARLSEEYPGLKIIFTGGDGIYFAKRLKYPIFANYNPVIRGLNRILEFNANN